MAVPLRSTGAPAARPRPRPGSTTSPRRSAAQRSRRDHLTVVPVRRRTAGLLFTVAIVLAGLMLGAAALNTTLAERQLRVDELEQRVTEATDRFELLRGQRAELRSPGRLSRAAAELGMFPGTNGVFVRVDPAAYARALAATGSIEEADRIVRSEQPLDQFRRIKGSGD